MRSSLWLGLTLLAFYCLLRPSHAVGWGAGPPPPAPPRQGKGPGRAEKFPDLLPLWSTSVHGVGPTARAARTDAEAIDRACQELAGYLKQNHPEIDWLPGADYLERAKMLQVVGEPEAKQSDRAGPYFEATIEVSVNREQLRELREVARQHRVQHRHHLAALTLVALSVLLAVAFGYLKLEEMTRGFYTNLLRAVAVGVLVLTGAGLWLLH
jgi:hypothetical protein